MTQTRSLAVSIGQNIGPYRIEALLGAGGMGVVYLAHDSELGRRVAIKLVDREYADHDSTRLLLREARATAALNHPAICGVHQVGHLGDRAFIVLEHVEGTPLSNMIPCDRGLPLETAIHYAIDIVDAVAHAHERGVVHGDLKTSNVMIGPGGRVKVLDFGLAVRREADGAAAAAAETTRSRESRWAAGTVAYMSPELLRGQVADPRSDIWAIGVVMFEMLAGARPFRGATGYELAARILDGSPGVLSGRVPLDLRRLVLRCLARHPTDRFASARDLAVALDDLALTGAAKVHSRAV
jgi:serine/threonine protein kinase